MRLASVPASVVASMTRPEDRPETRPWPGFADIDHISGAHSALTSADDEFQHFVVGCVQHSSGSPALMAIEAMGSNCLIRRASEKQAPVAERLEVTDHHVQELLPETSTLVLRKQGQDDDLACGRLAKAVPNDLARMHTDVAGKASVLDSFSPGVNGDTYGLELFDGKGVLSCLAPDSYTGWRVFGNGIAK